MLNPWNKVAFFGVWQPHCYCCSHLWSMYKQPLQYRTWKGANKKFACVVGRLGQLKSMTEFQEFSGMVYYFASSSRKDLEIFATKLQSSFTVKAFDSIMLLNLWNSEMPTNVCLNQDLAASEVRYLKHLSPNCTQEQYKCTGQKWSKNMSHRA